MQVMFHQIFILTYIHCLDTIQIDTHEDILESLII